MLNPDDKAFLDQFEQRDRSLISNMFLEAVRAGHKAPEAVVLYVRLDAQQRIRNLARYGREDSHERERMNLLIAGMDSPAALAFARYSIAWDALPRSEREKIKANKGAQFARQAMEAKSPSVSQLAFLTSLGYKGPAPDNSLEASRLIDRLRTGGAAK